MGRIALVAAFTLLAAPATAIADAPDLPVVAVAPGVYLHAGQVADFTPQNNGDLANLAFVVGERCVAVIDTGGSPALGRRLRTAIGAVTPLPVCYVLATHMHPDHLAGHEAFVGDHPVFIGHAHLPNALAARTQRYTAALRRSLEAPGLVMEWIAPTRLVEGELTLDLGGRQLRVRAWPTAHTDNDITVWDETSGTLFLGDLLFVDHLPVLDGSLKGWIGVLADLQNLSPKRCVPGHGPTPAECSAALAREGDYLAHLRADVRLALRAGKSLPQTVAFLDQQISGEWRLTDLYHRRNVTAAYAELEWED